MRRFLLALLCGCILLSVSWFTPAFHIPTAQAHAFVIGSDPVDGSLIDKVPTRIRIFFNGPISPASSAEVVTPDGQIVNAGPADVSGTDKRELDVLVLNPEKLPQGGYLIRWKALAVEDGHTTQGAIGFDVGRSSSGVAGNVIVGPTTSNYMPELTIFGAIAIFWQSIALFCAFLWIGLLLFSYVLARFKILTAKSLALLHTQFNIAQRYSLSGLIIAEMLTLITQAMQLRPETGISLATLQATLEILGTTQYGILWIARILLAGVAIVVLWRNRNQTQSIAKNSFRALRQQLASDNDEQVRHTPPITTSIAKTKTPWLLLSIAALQLLTLTLTLDAFQSDQAIISATIFGWLSLLAQSTLTGVVVGLCYILLPVLTQLAPVHSTKILSYTLRRFTPIILGSLALLVISSIVLNELTLQNLSQLITTPYGRAILVATSLIIIFIILAVCILYHFRRKLPHIQVAQPAEWIDETTLEHINFSQPHKSATTKSSKLERNIRWGFLLQTWCMAGLAICAALMMFFAPPIVFPNVNAQTRSNTETNGGGTAQNNQIKQLGDLTVALQILPGQLNAKNTMLVTLMRPDGSFITNAKVKIVPDMPAMAMADVQATATQGNPTYVLDFPRSQVFNMSGLWHIDVIIELPNQPPVQTRFEFIPKA